MPFVANPIPTIHDGTVVRGEATGEFAALQMDLPEYPKTASSLASGRPDGAGARIGARIERPLP